MEGYLGRSDKEIMVFTKSGTRMTLDSWLGDKEVGDLSDIENFEFGKIGGETMGRKKTEVGMERERKIIEIVKEKGPINLWKISQTIPLEYRLVQRHWQKMKSRTDLFSIVQQYHGPYAVLLDLLPEWKNKSMEEILQAYYGEKVHREVGCFASLPISEEERKIPEIIDRQKPTMDVSLISKVTTEGITIPIRINIEIFVEVRK